MSIVDLRDYKIPEPPEEKEDSNPSLVTDQDDELDVEHNVFPSRVPSKPVHLSTRTSKKNSSHNFENMYMRLASIDRYASKESE